MKSLVSLFTVLFLSLLATGVAAKGGKAPKITIIHKPYAQAIEITINENALPAHLAHGDCIVDASGPDACTPPPDQCELTANYEVFPRNTTEIVQTEQGALEYDVVAKDVVWNGVVCSQTQFDTVVNEIVEVNYEYSFYDTELEEITKSFDAPRVCKIDSDTISYFPATEDGAFTLDNVYALCVDGLVE